MSCHEYGRLDRVAAISIEPRPGQPGNRPRRWRRCNAWRAPRGGAVPPGAPATAAAGGAPAAPPSKLGQPGRSPQNKLIKLFIAVVNAI